MTIRRTAKPVLFCLALIALAGAETVWSLALSNAPDTGCRRPASSAEIACPCRSGTPMMLSARRERGRATDAAGAATSMP